MSKVGIVMGSDSDISVMSKAADILDEFGVNYEMRIISAHRNPDILDKFCKDFANDDGRVIIAGAGKAAALPGCCAANFPYPVIGVPIKTSDLGGVDSLYSIVQMPSGVPVATVAINGAVNAGLLAVEMLAVSDEKLHKKLIDYRQKQRQGVIDKDALLQEKGRKAFD